MEQKINNYLREVGAEKERRGGGQVVEAKAVGVRREGTRMSSMRP